MSDAGSTSTRTIADFNARAAGWDDDPVKMERARSVAEAIVRTVPLPPTVRALEYGAGTGLLSFLLRSHLGDITLADVSEGMLAVAARKIADARDAHMHPVKLDLLADPLPETRFDIVYSLMTLHHVGDTRAILNRFHALLAPAGVLCIADLDREDGSFHGVGFDGHNGFDRDVLGAMARDSGFGNVRFMTAYEMRKIVDGGERIYPIFLMSATVR